jgi:myosin heavy subunit
MEAWFDDFSYALKDPATGACQVVARDDQTAFLSKHLRAYGGSGAYGRYRLGRVLRHIVFAGKGIVTHPANPDSIIKDVASLRVAAGRIDKPDSHAEGGATPMPNEHETVEAVQAKLDKLSKVDELSKVDDLSKGLEAKTKEHEQVVAELATLKAQKLDEQVATLKAKVKEYESAIEALTAKAVETNKAVAEITQRAEQAEAELADIRKLETARQRLARLSQVKTIEDTEASLKELAEMADDTFAMVLKYAGEKRTASAPPKTETLRTDEAKAEDAATAALDHVQPIDEPNLQGGETDEQQSLVTVAKATARCLLKQDRCLPKQDHCLLKQDHCLLKQASEAEGNK